MSRLLLRVVQAATLGLLLLLGSAPAEAASFTQARRHGLIAPSDRDRNKLFDGLETRLGALPDHGRLSVIVTLRAPATAARTDALTGEVGAFPVSRRFRLIHAFSARMTEEQLEALVKLPVVAHVEENSAVYAANDSAQRSFGVAKARIDASVDGDSDGNAELYSKDDLVAAVIDSGIDATHADLDEGKVIAFKDFVAGRTTPYDDHGHGTSVAATLAGEGDARADRRYAGVAPGAALVGVKVLDADGRATLADVTAAIEWTVANRDVYGIEAINLSLASVGCSAGDDAASLAVDAAHGAGLVVVVAAGNDGPGTCTIGSPAAAAGGLAVGAMADTGTMGFTLAPFSSRGPTLDGRIKPDVSAPGVSITSAVAGTITGYGTNSGTSMAAPFVTGLALLLWDASPGLSTVEVEGAITGTAIDWGRGETNRVPGSTGPDVDYGAGRLDAYAAIEAAAGADIGTPPPAPRHKLLEGNLPATGAQADHALEVTDTGFPIAATLIIPSLGGGVASSPDLDLRLLDPDGLQVAAASSNRRQDELGYLPTAPGLYTLRVTAFSGSADYFVDVSGGLAARAPANTEPPAIAGLAEDGQVLTAERGTWTGTAPLSFRYQWARCDTSGSPCTEVPGESGATYDVTPADVGTTLKVSVSAANEGGEAVAMSTPTLPVEPAAPASVGLPTISGPARVGGRLSANAGTWTGTPPLALAYQWWSCDAAASACHELVGATDPFYDARHADIGRSIYVVVTATNGRGSAVASSLRTETLAAVLFLIRGTPAPDRLAGSGRDERFRALRGNDDVRAHGGGDVLYGGRGADFLLGGSGGDDLMGGPGRDHLDGGAGDDVLEASGGGRDLLRCGPGRDRAIADLWDRVATDCELVTRRPA